LKPGLDLCLIVLESFIFEAPQLEWFRETLASCQGPSTYRIVATHFPLLTDGIYAKDSKVTKLRNQILPLLEEYGVHAYIAGHEHQMQALERGGIHFLVSGATSLLNEWNPSNTSMWESELKFFNKKDAGFLAFSLSDDGSLTYNFGRASDNAVLYSCSLKKLGVKWDHVAGSGPTQSVTNPFFQQSGSRVEKAAVSPSYKLDGGTTLKPKSATTDSGSQSDKNGTGTLFYISWLVSFALAIVAVKKRDISTNTLLLRFCHPVIRSVIYST
jgi:3',5'-cyclic AMP phosphodiesterase CpdA